jgi:hypothetical protein
MQLESRVVGIGPGTLKLAFMIKLIDRIHRCLLKFCRAAQLIINWQRSRILRRAVCGTKVQTPSPLVTGFRLGQVKLARLGVHCCYELQPAPRLRPG